ncbi:hypothetical protein [Simkania sp.]|uniref:hypothetical protein n=1 Tax=Simkania sp. TaxID=34094 RepID=UPI003B521A0A
MTTLAYHTEGGWEAQENAEFQALMQQMESFKSAGQRYEFCEVFVFGFMSQFFGGQASWQAHVIKHLSNVELYDTQAIEYPFDQVVNNGLGGDNPAGMMKLTQQAYYAANNMLEDLYTNPMFDGTKIPQEVLNDLVTIFGLSPKEVLPKNVTVTIDGKPEQKKVPYFYAGYDKNDPEDSLVGKTYNFWESGVNDAPGDPNFTKWMDQMQVVSQKIQQIISFFTDMSSTSQSEVNFDMSEQKEYLGSWHSLLKAVASMLQTWVRNELAR